MAPGTFAKMSEDKVGTSARVEIQKVASPTVQAKQAIGVFDSGSGGAVAAYLTLPPGQMPLTSTWMSTRCAPLPLSVAALLHSPVNALQKEPLTL
jgi:hypothetical protein